MAGMLERLGVLRRLWSSDGYEAELQKQLEEARKRIPVPVFWLFGKTQSGKTSVIKFLTGADAAEIGHGYRPCTRFSRLYQFPTHEAPLLEFLDTRGIDEPGYNAAEDLAKFGDQAHVIIVTARVLDHALQNVLTNLREIREARPSRPVVLALTCLHEAYPQQQHPQPYPFTDTLDPPGIPEDLRRSIAEQRQRFEGLVDVIVPIDLTRPEEGYEDPTYGGEHLRKVLMDLLPGAYRQTFLALDRETKELQDLHLRYAVPVIMGYSYLAATAGAFPIPFIDLFIVPGIQTRMITHLARMYGQPLSGERFREIAASLGLGLLARQAAREVSKFVPWVGSVAGAALAGASTYALGRAFCYYYQAVYEGHVPKADELKRYFQEQLSEAEQVWKTKKNEPKK